MTDVSMGIWERIKNLGASLLHIDWILFGLALVISLAGLLTMNSFEGQSYYYHRQIIWIIISVVVFFVASIIDWRFLRRTTVVTWLYIVSATLLLLLFAVGSIFRGAQSWFSLGGLSFQPSDLAELVLIILLAKYFSRRHVEIADVRHILISGLYAFILFVLVFLQPDFGAAIILFCVWLGMVLVSGISIKHLLSVFALGIFSFIILWGFVFKPYQKDRILTFIHPLTDIRGSGYNAYQSTIAVGSGRILGKGVGYGTQSKLQFLPEYQTDFIFAAFAEEWGFVGASVLMILYAIVLWRIVSNAFYGASNFETLFGLGLAILFFTHIVIHVGMNIGLLPVTGQTTPFMSYGGSHLILEFLGLGILMGMRKYNRSANKLDVKNEFVGIIS
jgi:rod shape determining protein RodA